MDDHSFLNQDRRVSLKQEEDEIPQIKDEVEEAHLHELRLKKAPGEHLMTSVTQKNNERQTKQVRNTTSSSFTCEKSTKDFDYRSDFLMHLRSHIDNDQLVYRTCLCHFSSHDDLLDHIKTHMKERPHLCHKCGKTFSESIKLKFHIKQHTGERPHVCKTCGKTCQSNLKVHETIHQTNTGDKPNVCKVCNKVSKELSNLKII